MAKKSKTYAGAVKLRSKKLASGFESFYLDIYRDGKRTYEFLKLYTTGQASEDEDIREIAKKIRAQRELEIQSAERGLMTTRVRKQNFVEYFEAIAKSSGHKSWVAVLGHLRAFAEGHWPFEKVTPSSLRDFIAYLNKCCGQSTVWLYFGKVSSALNQAVRDGVLPHNPADRLEGRDRPRRRKGIPKYLTLDEVEALKKTPCPNEAVGRAFIFSCYTGMARCDIRELRWQQIDHEGVHYYRLKTRNSAQKDPTSVPLHTTALAMIGVRGDDNALVFPELPSDRYIGSVLTKWAQRAGVRRNVTYHVARHTFATLSIAHGSDIYTVSKLMGHSGMQYTTGYAAVLDQAKRDAISRLPTI